MTPLDLAVIAAYFALTLGVGLAMARGASRSADDYFLGARHLPAPLVMLSIIATETSALTVISVPGIAARGDFTFLQLAFGYLIGRIAVAWWLLPGYFTGSQQTAYERLQARFGLATRQALSAVFLVTRFLADGVRVFAGAIPLALVTGWDVSWAIVALGGVTLLYTFAGGLKAVVWADALQLAVYVAGGAAALVVAVQMAGGWGATFDAAAAAEKLRLFDFSLSLSAPYTLLGGLVGGALLSAASHGTDQIIVQRLLATRSLRAARWALVGSGVGVILQFALFLALGTALWASGQAPAGVRGDELFPRFVVTHLPSGLAGLVVAGVLAAAMSTVSSSISALASSLTHDLVAPRLAPPPPPPPAEMSEQTPPHTEAHAVAAARSAQLLRVGRWASLGWGVALIGAALGLHALAAGRDTPVVVLALSIASVTYGALLGAYVLAAWPAAPRRGPALTGADVRFGAAVAVVAMLGVVFAGRLAVWPPLDWLAPLGSLAFPWYVPLGTALTVGAALASATVTPSRPPPGRPKAAAAPSGGGGAAPVRRAARGPTLSGPRNPPA